MQRAALAAPFLIVALAGCATAEPAPPATVTAPTTEAYVSSLAPPSEQERIYLDVLAGYGMDTQGEAGDTLRVTSARICALEGAGTPFPDMLDELTDRGYSQDEAAWMMGAADARYCAATAG